MGDLNVGIVGLGWAAGAHIETFKAVQGANVTAICSRRAHDPAELERQYGVPLRLYNDYTEMLADKDLHVVDICTPHPFHPDQAVAAAKAGKHLVIEKPIALSFEDARRVKAAIDEARVKTCVCFELRFSAHFSMIRAVLEENLLGDIHYGEVDYYHGIGPWYGQFGWNVKKDMGGSSLLTAGCHALDALLMWMQDPVEEVTSYATTSRSPVFEPYEYPTTSTSILRFEGGKVGKCASVIDCFQPYYFHTHLVGSEGSLLDNKFYSQKLPGMTKLRWSTLETALVDSGDVSDHPYQPQFQALVDAIRNDTPMPHTDFDTAYETHRVAFAADLSAARGRPVKLSELE
jgi:predicted dehydrogenase